MTRNDDSCGSFDLSRRTFVAATALTGGLGGTISTTASASDHDIVQVGSGSYTTTLPDGMDEPPESISVTSSVEGPIDSNDWWSSLLWEDFSENLFVHPLYVDASEDGLDVGFPTEWTFSREGRLDHVTAMMELQTDLTIGHTGGTFDDSQVDGWGDWSVSTVWGADTSSTLRVTMAQGSPFLYCEYEGGGAELSFPSTPDVHDEGNVLRIQSNGNVYGVFAPEGATWNGIGSDTLTSDLDGEEYLSVALLPDDSDDALSTYADYAYNRIVDTRIDWVYDKHEATVESTFSFETVDRPESGSDGVLTTLYPHQWKYSDASTEAWSYTTQRGEQRVYTGSSFSVTYEYRGMLPYLPDVGDYDQDELEGYVQEVADEDELIRPGPEDPGDDTYWTGKNFERLVQLLPIAEAVGATDARDRFENAMRDELEIWLDATVSGDTDSPDVFYYNDNWRSLLGYHDSHGSADNLNDHHFHYGYYVKGAAAIARTDPDWADSDNWGGMIEQLIRDYAGYDRSDDKYPFLRNHDPYAGHSWASGNALFEEGNNQESSSESLNAYAAMIEWGEYTGNTELRDAGIFLYTTELHAVQEYWFDIDGDSHPPEWDHDYSSNVWGNGYWYKTWWTLDIEAIHGINFMPLDGYSHHLGWDDEHAEANYQEIVENRGGDDFDYYPDLMWMFRAFSDSQDALALWEADKDDYDVEFGMSRAQTYYWLTALDATGSPEPSITADHSLYTVFSTDDGALTYAAYNPGDSSITVSFSDGTSLDVPANSMATTTDSDGDNGGGDEEPAAPTNLHSPSNTDTTVDLEWDHDGANTAHYNVYVDGSRYGESANTSETVSGLDPDTGYEFTVTAESDDGIESDPSNTISVTTDADDGDMGDSAPSIDQFDVSDTSSGPWTRFNVEWAVSDPDGDLDLVEIEMIDDSGTVVDSTSTAVSGDSASGEDSVRERNGGGEYELELTVTDEAGNSATETKTVAVA
ncbi:glycosyl hydrolase [Natronosalvus amylolyticus]|uniref:glycosyl hydrolase n=1 Tax=Natronosalvus amylolyticus TaxID=2961994 RepID=UPI0020C9DCAE|nr:glycosyl hydrolase [Natronosalvus amylolyticus]